MLKKLSALTLGIVSAVTFASGSQASASEWNLYGAPPGNNSMYVSSQGNITINPVNQYVNFDGWASTIWKGGWGEDITMKIYAKTYTTYVNGTANLSSVHEDTHTFPDGINQKNLSVTINDNYSSFGLWTARVQANGWVKFDDGANYFKADAVGNDGV
ncbi:hypothetical protein MKZ21_30570 [Paenibacillus sp. FSL P2-0536]|uniref:hypothetical protein n=1 Tax=Paenibacillus sp. FSL P2-0536 TaxID=2921629 RepID=UPI0030F6B218